jgi:hypothetical protein
LQLQTTYSDFDYFEILLRVLLKNTEIFLKKCPKFSFISWVVEILHEHALLVAASNYILRFIYFFKIRLRVLLKFSEIFLKKCQKKSKSACVEAGELKFCMNMLYYESFKVLFSDS